MKKYLFHWFGYCYYRLVDFCTLFSFIDYGEPDYEGGRLPFVANIVLAQLVILPKSITDLEIFSNKWYVVIEIIALYFLLFLVFNKKKYEKMKRMFANEPKTLKHIMGVLAFLTVFMPVIIIMLSTIIKVGTIL